jgi:hypothetical protein
MVRRAAAATENTWWRSWPRTRDVQVSNSVCHVFSCKPLSVSLSVSRCAQDVRWNSLLLNGEFLHLMLGSVNMLLIFLIGVDNLSLVFSSFRTLLWFEYLNLMPKFLDC